MFKKPIQKMSAGALQFKEPLKNPHLALFIANALGAGKTNCIIDIAHRIHNHFHRIIWFAPNGECDRTIKDVFSESVELITKASELLKTLKEVEKAAKDAAEEDEELDRVLVVLDDSICNNLVFPQGRAKTELINMLVSLRHLQVTCFITIHRYTLCPSTLRDNAKFLYVFETNDKQLKSIAETLSFRDPEIFLKAYYTYVKEKYNFILVDKTEKKIYSNVNRLVYDQVTGFIADELRIDSYRSLLAEPAKDDSKATKRLAKTSLRKKKQV